MSDEVPETVTVGPVEPDPQRDPNWCYVHRVQEFFCRADDTAGE